MADGGGDGKNIGVDITNLRRFAGGVVRMSSGLGYEPD